MKSQPQVRRLKKKEKSRLVRRTAVAAALCCGMGHADAVLAAICGPGRSLPVNTWLMTAPSCDPSPADLVSQYGDNIPSGNYGTNWVSYKWDPVAGSYGGAQAGTAPLQPGIGNWLYSVNAGTLFLSGAAAATVPCASYGSGLLGKCFAIDLTPSGSDIWQIIGNTFPYAVDWRNVRVASSSDGGTTWTQRTPSQAADAGVNLMAKEYWRWSGSSYETKDDVTLGSIGALKPQESVWVRIKSGSNGLSAGNFKLLIPVRELNDTGITWSGNYASGNNATCVASSTPNGDNVVVAQDCSHGPDVTGNDDADGLAGFSYTKLDSNGQPLANQAADYATTPWACVQDNVTGLIWEGKTDDGGLHDKDDIFTWYNTDPNTNGGANGFDGAANNTCSGYVSGNAATYCNTQAYVARVNTAGLCGANDWRMPTIKELESLVNYSRTNPAADTGYFPNTPFGTVWSGSPLAGYSDYAWYINFVFGYSNNAYRNNTPAIRLVRGGQ
ncbi:MAG: Lcl C-terminal domain-containing protein [Candidatus Electronema sp. V4]|uniref:Lcl C-terminal domain-containing protein n=1 Tax=Candidatus Electronema sp. V4 TaxID=3454756 RepID=UPI0040557683